MGRVAIGASVTSGHSSSYGTTTLDGEREREGGGEGERPDSIRVHYTRVPSDTYAGITTLTCSRS